MRLNKFTKTHKTSIDWTIIVMKLVCRWLGGRTWVLIGDGAYACMHLAHACIKKGVTLVSRLRLDAQLYEFPEAETMSECQRITRESKVKPPPCVPSKKIGLSILILSRD